METIKTDGKTVIFLIPAAVILGAGAGGIIWLFLKVLEGGTALIWETLPSHFEFVFYPLIICVFGGLIIGLLRKKVGDYPEDIESVMEVVKETKRYGSRKVYILFIVSILPLLFGGSVGPEAGLAGIVAALCTWVGDRFRHIKKEMGELTEVSVSASLSILFTAPLFGFLAQVEGEKENRSFPGRDKIIVYFSAIFSGLCVLLLLISLFGGGLQFERFGASLIGRNEIIWFIPLVIVGTAAGNLYHLIDRSARFAVGPLKRFPVAGSLLGGLLLGICGIFVPLVMFSGETQMTEVAGNWMLMTPAVLAATGLLKLLITNICINTGWRGGHIIPAIFAGVCFGYAMASVTGVDAVFAVAAVTTALCGAVIRKPLAVIMIMIIFFPLKDIIVLSFAAFIGAWLTLKDKKPELLPNQI